MGDCRGLAIPWPHVWLGVTVELPRHYRRIEHLRAVPAALRFLSLEPLLGALPALPLDGIDWVIVGGDSGPGHQSMDLDALRDVCAQVIAARVPLFVKQDSGPRPGRQGRIPDALWRHKAFPVTREESGP